jgi:hypothetical protein
MVKSKKILSGLVFSLVLTLGATSVLAVDKSGSANLGSGCKVDCYLQAQGASGYSTTRAYVTNSSYRAKAYVEACSGSSVRIKTSGWSVAASASNNYTKATVDQAYGATEYHSSHTCSGPASINGMMVRL